VKQIPAIVVDFGGLESRAVSCPALTPCAGRVRERVNGLVTLGEPVMKQEKFPFQCLVEFLGFE